MSHSRATGRPHASALNLFVLCPPSELQASAGQICIGIFSVKPPPSQTCGFDASQAAFALHHSTSVLPTPVPVSSFSSPDLGETCDSSCVLAACKLAWEKIRVHSRLKMADAGPTEWV